MRRSIQKNLENLHADTPSKLGYFIPAEFSPHEATWLTWPQNQSDWLGKIGAVRLAYGHICTKLSKHEKVRIIIGSKIREEEAREIFNKLGVKMERIEFYKFPTNRSWIRDNGPLFLKKEEDSTVAISRFHFNGWGLYPEYNKDDQIPPRVAKALSAKIFEPKCAQGCVYLEGGCFDVNGRGTILISESCLVDTGRQVRNPGLTRSEAEKILKEYLGVSNILWVGGELVGDETNGHVDNLCRFTDPKTVVASREKNASDPNYRPLEENWERLQVMALEDGSKINLVELPMPEPLYFKGDRLPASYANFYIANEQVLVPTFNDQSDRVALGILQDLFPDRTVVGIHCVDLVVGGGTIHCSTQQQPSII